MVKEIRRKYLVLYELIERTATFVSVLFLKKNYHFHYFHELTFGNSGNAGNTPTIHFQITIVHSCSATEIVAVACSSGSM